MKYILTLQFDIEVETGNKDIADIEKMVTLSYSGYCGERVIVVRKELK